MKNKKVRSTSLGIALAAVFIFSLAGCGDKKSGSILGSVALEIDRIEVTGNYKTQYNLNEQLDIDGIEVTVYYTNGTSKTVAITASNITGFDTSTTGNKTITITYGTKIVTFGISVVNLAGIDRLEVTSNCKTEYNIGETLDLTGLEVTVWYLDGTSTVVTNISASNISGFDSSTIGAKTITITYGNKTVLFVITVVDSSLPSLNAVTADPDSGFGKSGATFIVTLAKAPGDPADTEIYYTLDGSAPGVTTFKYTSPITITLSDATVVLKAVAIKEGYNPSTVITATYTLVTVIEIEIAEPPTTTSYMLGNPLSTSGLKINVFWSDGNMENITSGFEIVQGITDNTGQCEVTVMYGGKYTSFFVYFADPTLETLDAPVISPGSGEVAFGTQVTISKGANNPVNTEIWYCFGNGIPSVGGSDSFKYTGPITLTKPTNISAIAVCEGWNNSSFDYRNYEFPPITISGNVDLFYSGGRYSFGGIVDVYDFSEITLSSIPKKLGRGEFDENGQWSVEIPPSATPRNLYFAVMGYFLSNYEKSNKTIQASNQDVSGVNLGLFASGNITLSGTVVAPVGGVAPYRVRVYVYNTYNTLGFVNLLGSYDIDNYSPANKNWSIPYIPSSTSTSRNLYFKVSCDVYADEATYRSNTYTSDVLPQIVTYLNKSDIALAPNMDSQTITWSGNCDITVDGGKPDNCYIDLCLNNTPPSENHGDDPPINNQRLAAVKLVSGSGNNWTWSVPIMKQSPSKTLYIKVTYDKGIESASKWVSGKTVSIGSNNVTTSDLGLINFGSIILSGTITSYKLNGAVMSPAEGGTGFTSGPAGSMQKGQFALRVYTTSTREFDSQVGQMKNTYYSPSGRPGEPAEGWYTDSPFSNPGGPPAGTLSTLPGAFTCRIMSFDVPTTVYIFAETNIFVQEGSEIRSKSCSVLVDTIQVGSTNISGKSYAPNFYIVPKINFSGTVGTVTIPAGVGTVPVGPNGENVFISICTTPVFDMTYANVVANGMGSSSGTWASIEPIESFASNTTLYFIVMVMGTDGFGYQKYTGISRTVKDTDVSGVAFGNLSFAAGDKFELPPGP